MENLTQRWTQSGTSFSKITAIFSVFRKEPGKPLRPSSCAPVSEAKYVSISLNISKYTWKCLNKLFWLSQGSEYAWSSYMFGRLLKMPWVLNMPEFWMWHGCICKGYREFWICLSMARSRCLNLRKYSRIYFNMSEYGWINCPGYILDIWQSFKYASGIKYVRVLNMLRYSYNSDILQYTGHKRLKNLCNNKVKQAEQK